MKGKRFLCAVIAVMMLFTCFIVSASADAIIDPNQKCKITVKLAADGSPIKDAVFTITGDSLTDPVEIKTNENGVAVTADETGAPTLPQGTFHVEQSASGLGVNQATAAAAFDVTLPMTDPATLDNWLYEITVEPKVTVFMTEPTISKFVADVDEESAYGQSASIMSYTESLAYWKVTVSLPENINNYQYLKVTDKIETRLSDFALLRVVNNADGKEITEADGDFTQSYENRVFTLNFSDNCIKTKLKDNTTVDIFFTTKIDLSQDKTIGEKIGNHVVLNFTNAAGIDGVTDNTPDTDGDKFDPDAQTDTDAAAGSDTDTSGTNSDTDTETVPAPTPEWPTNPGDDPRTTDPYVWTGALEFTKIKKGDDSTKLDAEFQLYNADTNEAIGGVIKAENGVYSIKGLKGGSIAKPYNYYLVETKAPAGYELIGTKLPFSVAGIDTAIVKFAGTNAQSVNEATEVFFSFADANYIVNIPSPALPVTGGIGVWFYAFVGLALAAAGAFLAKTKKVGAR